MNKNLMLFACLGSIFYSPLTMAADTQPQFMGTGSGLGGTEFQSQQNVASTKVVGQFFNATGAEDKSCTVAHSELQFNGTADQMTSDALADPFGHSTD